MKKRAFLIVLDSVGIGELPDAADFGDAGSHTLRSISTSPYFSVPNLISLGLSSVKGCDFLPENPSPKAAFGRMAEKSRGKDTTIGHWELCGVISEKPLPVYPEGFPQDLITKFENLCGRKVLCNKPYSGTEVIARYGKEHISSGDLIVYTSADSVFQIAAHEEVVSLDELYAICRMARELLQGEHGVGRVIARPFVGEEGNFKRTANRHDYSLPAPCKTLLDALKEQGKDVIGIGKIEDIFASRGVTESIRTRDNNEGMEVILSQTKKDFDGLCFLNLVEFDSVYGHRNDIHGYAKALSDFDRFLPEFLEALKEDDLLLICADHGCDPGTVSTDHSREYVPLLAYGKNLVSADLETRESFSDVACTLAEFFDLSAQFSGQSFLSRISGDSK